MSKPYLLPHEKWLVRKLARTQQRNPQTPELIKLRVNYGPVGSVLYGAALASFSMGWLLGIAGIVTLFAEERPGVVLVLEFLICIVFLLTCLVRAGQMAKVGKGFRRGRILFKRSDAVPVELCERYAAGEFGRYPGLEGPGASQQPR